LSLPEESLPSYSSTEDSLPSYSFPKDDPASSAFPSSAEESHSLESVTFDSNPFNTTALSSYSSFPISAAIPSDQTSKSPNEYVSSFSLPSTEYTSTAQGADNDYDTELPTYASKPIFPASDSSITETPSISYKDQLSPSSSLDPHLTLEEGSLFAIEKDLLQGSIGDNPLTDYENNNLTGSHSTEDSNDKNDPVSNENTDDHLPSYKDDPLPSYNDDDLLTYAQPAYDPFKFQAERLPPTSPTPAVVTPTLAAAASRTTTRQPSRQQASSPGIQEVNSEAEVVDLRALLASGLNKGSLQIDGHQATSVLPPRLRTTTTRRPKTTSAGTKENSTPLLDPLPNISQVFVSQPESHTRTTKRPAIEGNIFNQPVAVFGNNLQNSVSFNPFGVSFSSGFPSTTGRPRSSTSTSTTINSRTTKRVQTRPTVTPASVEELFTTEGKASQLQALTTTPSTAANPGQLSNSAATADTTKRTTATTTRRSLLLQESNKRPSQVDDGLVGKPTENFIGFSLGGRRPSTAGFDKLQIGPTVVKEIPSGGSGIFFSTPSGTFVTPANFGSPPPAKSHKNKTVSGFRNLEEQTDNDSNKHPLSLVIQTTTQDPVTASKTGSNFHGDKKPTKKPVIQDLVAPDVELSETSTTTEAAITTTTVRTTSTTPRAAITKAFNIPAASVVPLSFGFSPQLSGFGRLVSKTPATISTKKPVTGKPSARSSTSLAPIVRSSLRPQGAASSRLVKGQTHLLDKDESSTEPTTTISTALTEDAFTKRNMLMNIILRPGGGDKDKALPRPKVEVSSEGANVILVRLTFPENENIQGLRAFTPTDPADLEKFDELRNAISAESHGNIERLTAVSSEEIGSNEKIDATQKTVLSPRKKGTSSLLKEHASSIVSNPTRPTRPPKELSKTGPRQGKSDAVDIRPHFSYLPPSAPSSSATLVQPQSAKARQPKKATTSNGIKGWNKLHRIDQESIREAEETDSFPSFVEGLQTSRTKPQSSQEKPGVYYPAYEPFRPDEAIPSNRNVRQFLSKETALGSSLANGKLASGGMNNSNKNSDTLFDNQNSVTSSAVQRDSLVVYNTSPPPSLHSYAQPPRPDHPPPPRTARLDSWAALQTAPQAAVPPPPRPRSQPASLPEVSNPFTFLLPKGGQQEDWRHRKYPRIEVRKIIIEEPNIKFLHMFFSMLILGLCLFFKYLA
jgi:hypothetical protein